MSYPLADLRGQQLLSWEPVAREIVCFAIGSSTSIVDSSLNPKIVLFPARLLYFQEHTVIYYIAG